MRSALWLVLGLGCASVASADLDQIKIRGQLRVAAVTDGGRSVQSNARVGFDLEILEGFARLHRVQVQPVNLSDWSQLVGTLLAGKADLIAGGVNASEGRRKLIDFTIETLPTRSVVVSYAPGPPIATLAKLKEGSVGTLKGAAQVDDLRAAGVPASRILQFPKSPEMREALRSGAIVAQIVPVETALVAMTLDRNLKLGLYIGAPSSIAFGVRKQDVRLREALSEYISNFRHTPTWNRLLVKYFGESAIEILRRARAE